jgi:hypothetical protein
MVKTALRRSLPEWQGEYTATEQEGWQGNLKAIWKECNRHVKMLQRHITLCATLDRLCGAPHNRSLTIAPRRYRDPATGNWEDASSFRATDIPSLLLALEAAHRFVSSTPLPGQPAEEEPTEASPSDNGENPF